MYYGDINIRREMAEMIEASGYEILLQRHSNRFKCRCKSKGKSKLFGATTHCSLCNDTGKVIKLEKHKTSRHEYELDFSEATPMGNIDVPKFEFYFNYDVQITAGDIIYEVGWKGDKPASLHNIYEIKYIERPRCDNGRIEYVMATTFKKNINLEDRRRNFIRNITAYKNDFIMGEGHDA